MGDASCSSESQLVGPPEFFKEGVSAGGRALRNQKMLIVGLRGDLGCVRSLSQHWKAGSRKRFKAY